MGAVPHKLAPPPSHSYLIALTFKACELAKSAAINAAEGLASQSKAAWQAVAECERELDRLDREVDEGLAPALMQASPQEVRELLASFKFMLDLERVGDLISSLASRASAVGPRLDMEDVSDLIKMCSVLEKMLADIHQAFSTRNPNLAVAVLRRDGEIDRLRNMVLMRHLEDRASVAGPHSIHVVSMAQALERAGDHVKNLAEEVCHLVSGHSLRHALRDHDQSDEQRFIQHLRRQHLGRE